MAPGIEDPGVDKCEYQHNNSTYIIPQEEEVNADSNVHKNHQHTSTPNHLPGKSLHQEEIGNCNQKPEPIAIAKEIPIISEIALDFAFPSAMR